MIGPHVFGDGRLGLWVRGAENVYDRLPKIKNLPFGPVTDIFLPYTATRAHSDTVRQAGLYASVWSAPHGRDAVTFADESVADLDRIVAGALELNIEEPDHLLQQFIRDSVARIRSKKPKLRLRVNIAPFKAGFVPMDLVQSDPNLYVIVQSYFGNMDGRASEAEVLTDLLQWGCPLEKASVMYAAHCSDPLDKVVGRVPALPAWSIRRPTRGSIYNDDLLADAGLL